MPAREGVAAVRTILCSAGNDRPIAAGIIVEATTDDGLAPRRRVAESRERAPSAAYCCVETGRNVVRATTDRGVVPRRHIVLSAAHRALRSRSTVVRAGDQLPVDFERVVRRLCADAHMASGRDKK